MRIWRVTCQCFFRRTQLGKAERCLMSAFIESDNSEEAMSDGKNFIESQAPSDVLWVDFIPVSAASVQLPMLCS